MMVMYDGDPSEVVALAEEQGLTFPILVDPGNEVFGRWDPKRITPSTTLIAKGAVVQAIDTQWYNDMIEEMVTTD